MIFLVIKGAALLSNFLEGDTSEAGCQGHRKDFRGSNAAKVLLYLGFKIFKEVL
jgi:hypothetical protein